MVWNLYIQTCVQMYPYELYLFNNLKWLREHYIATLCCTVPNYSSEPSLMGLWFPQQWTQRGRWQWLHNTFKDALWSDQVRGSPLNVCVLAREGGSSERYLLHSYMGLEAVADSECLKGRGEKIKRAHSYSRGHIVIIYSMKGHQRAPIHFFHM